ncbi:1-phosphatidylinositol-4-phosphate 5-kinase [Marchantia polymorpha subsp. ruderalis]|uniref:1-phosphatidylinositol-4-phosphate 5-kinase n=2 Tax=Marchantia polymorpha TaxID=3197 RepID=A0AAF6B234_MARPO|nr:hypothetical protein MARPO_0140s0029 [Marchantia polymorpha]BBN06068.1 hypothetical protein Mp_3g18120 [Marchantia polymorpha subsp. ruderalis]|eukprot:PTQ29499.1 hypothetical protein MARPO_0140s0029 [Marchantia polymorpha]
MSGPVAHVDDEEELPRTSSYRLLDPGPHAEVAPTVNNERLNHVGDGEDFKGPSDGGVSVMHFNGEKVLPNGDFYVGSWQGSLPEGTGKYLWSDGCMYEGEWGRGKKTGRGKISWPSGATYEGDFQGGYMHGVGTYTGIDGTTYKGNWSMNVKHGLGRKRYANGDVYEGSWKQGVQEGPGRYVWRNGNEYIGEWRNGTMSGRGVLTWASGDVFDGQWLDGLEHGHGTYTWGDGGCYVGTWSRGLKDGKGVFYPAGSRRPEAVRNGLSQASREEIGAALEEQFSSRKMVRIRRSSFSDNEQYAASRRTSRSSSSERIQLTDTTKQHAEPAIRRNPSLERRWSLEGALERVLGLETSNPAWSGEPILEGDERAETGRHSLESVVPLQPPIVEREYVQGVLMSELVKEVGGPVPRHVRRRQRRATREIKRPGETIYKGHRSYDLMLNLQLGIRYTVGKITPEPKHEIGPADFGPRASIRVKFPKCGTALTPPHQSCDFKWKDYCPMVFRQLRELFKIDAADYMLSICGNDALRELSSPGKSGSVFYLSHDDRFYIKTMRKAEVKVLLAMLPAYHEHVRSYENTLITKFFGLHRVKPYGGQKASRRSPGAQSRSDALPSVRFIVMGNMFCTELRIHRRFDLKGSSQGRSADKVEIDENTTLKDLDLDFVFRLDPSWREALFKQVEVDCKFLESQRIMDYSLLLGLHFRAPQYPPAISPVPSPTVAELVPPPECVVAGPEDVSWPSEEEWSSSRGLVLVPRGPGEVVSVPGPHVRGSPLRASGTGLTGGDGEVDLVLPGTARLRIQLGVNMPARADRIPRRQEDDTNAALEKEIFGESYDVVLYFGIIDILQEYDISKRIEHAYKSLQFDASSISAVEPRLYAKRFQEFIQRTFPGNTLPPTLETLG